MVKPAIRAAACRNTRRCADINARTARASAFTRPMMPQRSAFMAAMVTSKTRVCRGAPRETCLMRYAKSRAARAVDEI